MKLLASLIGGTVLFRTPLPLATLCIIQVMFLIDNSVYAAEKEWPYKPVKKSPLPEVKNRDWANNGIDSFILSRLEAKGLSPAAKTDKRILVRRVYFDLIGSSPSNIEANRFVEDTDPKAYEKLVDRLLAGKRFGEKWALEATPTLT
jgi:hypothetical protein